MKADLSRLKNILLPALWFSFVTGTLTGVLILAYRFVAGKVIAGSEAIYGYMRENLWSILPAVAVLFLIAAGTGWLYRKIPNVKGGGIPTSIGILRGLIPFVWWRNLLGVWMSSLLTFLVGVPLGTEGPGVQMGTAMGRGTVRLMARKHRAWDRYVMTGGACAGFTAATGAPISGIMFALEEAHQRISPMIIMVAFSSVAFSHATVTVLAPLMGMEPALFPDVTAYVRGLELHELWIPLLVGLAVGLFSVLFLKAAALIRKLWQAKKFILPSELRIFLIFLVTLAMGLVSYDFISTGHHLIHELILGEGVWYILLMILLFRAVVMLCANSSGITGGMFLPVMTLGAIIAAILARIFTGLWLPSGDYFAVIVVLGIAACISGMMKSPLTAIFFAVEALGCGGNVLPVIIAVTVSYLLTELTRSQSINESVVRSRVEELHEDETPTVIDTFVTVQRDTFAVGKQIRDIFWPSNLFVLSIRHDPTAGAEVDEHGENTIRAGDILHVRYSCYDEAETREELFAIVGRQPMEEQRVEKV